MIVALLGGDGAWPPSALPPRAGLGTHTRAVLDRAGPSARIRPSVRLRPLREAPPLGEAPPLHEAPPPPRGSAPRRGSECWRPVGWGWGLRGWEPQAGDTPAPTWPRPAWCCLGTLPAARPPPPVAPGPRASRAMSRNELARLRTPCPRGASWTLRDAMTQVRAPEPGGRRLDRRQGLRPGTAWAILSCESSGTSSSRHPRAAFSCKPPGAHRRMDHTNQDSATLTPGREASAVQDARGRRGGSGVASVGGQVGDRQSPAWVGREQVSSTGLGLRSCCWGWWAPWAVEQDPESTGAGHHRLGTTHPTVLPPWVSWDTRAFPLQVLTRAGVAVGGG